MNKPWESRPESGSADIEVDLDGDGRVTGVVVRGLPDDARRPERIDAAFQRALATARSAALPVAPDVVDADGRVRAARVTMPAHRPLRELVSEALATQDPDRLPQGSGGSTTGPVLGMSDNKCVTVALDISGPGGQLQIDPGWLSQTSRTNLGAAVRQAFADAYRNGGLNERGTRWASR